MNPKGSSKKILIVAGEPSGDLHASNLVYDLKRLKPDLEFFGLGGALMQEAGVNISFDISKLALVGLVEVLKKIFLIGKVYRELLQKVDSERPDLAILVDYPGFNLRLAGELKKRSIPVIYYISPQVWAWGRDRIRIIKRCVKKVLVFFKFEEELYKTYNVDVEFVGHPLLDIVKADMPGNDILAKYSLRSGRPTIALLPGSRTMEVNSLLPVMVRAAQIIQKGLGEVQFIIAKHPGLPLDLYESSAKDSGLDMRIIEGATYNILSVSNFAMVASGTATLETAIMERPLLITYKTSLLTFILYRIVAKRGPVGLVNIIAGHIVAPELLQYDATPGNIARVTLDILNDKNKQEAIIKDLKEIRSKLGSSGASLRAAKAIIQSIL